MKSILVMLLVFCSILSTQAQIRKGTGFLSGVLSGSYSKSDNNNDGFGSNYSYRSNSWLVNVSYGNYITERIAIGIGAGFTTSDYKNTSSYTSPNGLTTSVNKQLSMLYYLSPFIRISKSISDNLYCFGSLYAKVGTGPERNTTTSSNGSPVNYDDTKTNYGGGLTGGLNYFLNNKFAFQLTYGDLSYSYTSTDPINDSAGENAKSTESGFNLGLGLSSISIGLQYFISCSKDKK